MDQLPRLRVTVEYTVIHCHIDMILVKMDPYLSIRKKSIDTMWMYIDNVTVMIRNGVRPLLNVLVLRCQIFLLTTDRAISLAVTTSFLSNCHFPPNGK